MLEIESRIQYKFKNKQIIKEAITHRSILNQANYEKLEFLGDTIINFYVTNWLFKHYRDENESNLSTRKAQLTSQQNLAKISKSLKLYKYINIDKNISISDRIHCDILESIIGAIYLDSNYQKVNTILDKIFIDFKKSNINYDFKGLIISMHKKGKIKNFSIDTNKYGDNKSFLTRINLESYYFYGFGRTKKSAEMRAATSAYNFIQ